MNENILPTHIGIILDGNRRWAEQNGLPTLEGHRKGYGTLKVIARAAFERGVTYVSAFCFSTENWNRTKQEVDYLMKLAMKLASVDAKKLIKENIKIVVLGIEEKVPPELVNQWRVIEDKSKNNTGGVLAICFNYGGKREIADAVKEIVRSGITEEKVNETLITKHLYHPEVPPIDLLIRTSGEQRISNFMLWRAAYAELYFTKLHWPDFSVKELDAALADYAHRTRRFGGN